ncbi:ATP-dependent RNA helicase DHX8 [Caerostris darwini]|uniref:ATP-dependent RNA helicase DHX8 n=1 Tax=Caerostris darwini TaxID=1538125 RepID=A0AAV4S3Q9_9ARAC|nr:ATP-dependent RNA helicase DHX8 [Caerostris darwini]
MDAPPPESVIAALEQLHSLSALDDEGLLTRLGKRMTNFPWSPICPRCSSCRSIWPADKQALAVQKKAKFNQPEGDHLTLLAVYNSWKNNKFSNAWCYDNFVQA